MIDDDYWEYKERQKGKVLLSRYIEIAQRAIEEANPNTGIIGFIREPFFFDKKDMPLIRSTSSHHQGQVLLNTQLARINDLVYRGVNEHGSLLEDIDMCYQFMAKGLGNMIINQVTAIENKAITSTICDYQHDNAAKLTYWKALHDLVARWKGTSLESQVQRLYNSRKKGFIKMGIIEDDTIPVTPKLWG
jgi:hypothetical protein